MSTATVRDKILNSALDLFAKKGFSATSMDEIAEHAGMKGPNLYKYFKGKEDIFHEIDSLMEGSYKLGMGMNPEYEVWIHNGEELKIYSMKQIEFTLHNENIRKLRKMCTIEQFRDEYQSKLASLHQFTNICNFYTKIFEGLIKYGAIEKCDPEMAAMEYFAPVSMLIQMYDREPEREKEIVSKMEQYIDFFIERYFIKK